MEKLKSMAEGFMGSQPSASVSDVPESPMGDLAGLIQGISPDQLGTMVRLFKQLNGAQDDDRTRLLLALRPHLSEKRQQRVDQAVKLLKIASVLPLVGESGLFSL